MVNHGYDVKRTGQVDIDRNLDAIKQALDVIAGAIVVPQILTFVTLGLNGAGSLPLVPPKMPNGTTPLYRALTGMRLVAAVDLSTLASLQTFFEQSLSKNDAIQQASSLNLSARTIIFVVQG